MPNRDKIQHEGVVIAMTGQTIEVQINSHSACSSCHAKGACGMSDTKQKTITTLSLPGQEIRIGDKVMVYASLQNASLAVILLYVVSSLLLLTSIFILLQTGYTEIEAAIGGIIILTLYFFILYLFRKKISKQITFTTTKIDNL